MARSLGSEVRNIRQSKGLSLNAVAKPAGVSATYLQKLERDGVESPSPHRLHRLAEALGMSYADLFKLAGYPVPISSETLSGTSSEIDDASVLRKAFLSPAFVSDDEVEELVRYLSFIRRQAED